LALLEYIEFLEVTLATMRPGLSMRTGGLIAQRQLLEGVGKELGVKKVKQHSLHSSQLSQFRKNSGPIGTISREQR